MRAVFAEKYIKKRKLVESLSLILIRDEYLRARPVQRGARAAKAETTITLKR